MIRLSEPNIKQEDIKLINEVILSGMLVQGQYVNQFEKMLSNYMGSKFVHAVSSGTAALHLAMVTLNVKEGDAIFVPAFTFPATVNVVEIQKARPVLVDVEENSYNMDPYKLEDALKSWKGVEKPHSIIVVHEFGNPCNMEAILDIAKRYGLHVIEDAACALGTTYNNQHVGTFGDIGCFSWHPRKGITTGEGGAITTNSSYFSNKIMLLRNHGIQRDQEGKIDFVLPGFNYRLTDFQAALGLPQLNDFKQALARRKEFANIYIEQLSTLSSIMLPIDNINHSWQTFMIVLSESIDREKLIKQLKEQGIETNIGAQAIHMLNYFKNKYSFSEEHYPIAAKLYKNGLAIPLHSRLSKKDIYYIIDKIKKLISKGNGGI